MPSLTGKGLSLYPRVSMTSSVNTGTGRLTQMASSLGSLGLPSLLPEMVQDQRRKEESRPGATKDAAREQGRGLARQFGVSMGDLGF